MKKLSAGIRSHFLRGIPEAGKLTHPLLQERSFILETPNDDDGYKAEIAMVKEAEKNATPPELTDREIYDTPIGPVCMSKTEHEAYLEEVEIRKLREK